MEACCSNPEWLLQGPELNKCWRIKEKAHSKVSSKWQNQIGQKMNKEYDQRNKTCPLRGEKQTETMQRNSR